MANTNNPCNWDDPWVDANTDSLNYPWNKPDFNDTVQSISLSQTDFEKIQQLKLKQHLEILKAEQEAMLAAKKQKEKEMASLEEGQKLTDPLRYDKAEDVNMRLHHSIVRYKGKPVQVNYWDGLFVKVRALDQPPSSPYWSDPIHSSNVDLDVSSPPLGYMNYDEVTFYVQRCPHRKQKQGFCNKTAAIHSETAIGPWMNVDPYELIWGKDMMNTILGIYPSGLSVLEKISSGEAKSLAFSRKFALVADDIGIIKLKHMTRSVGWFKPKTDNLIIPENYMNSVFEKELKKEGFILS